MTLEETDKLELGRTWLAHIDYDPLWSSQQFITAFAREDMSDEAAEAVMFALEHRGAQLLAEANEMESYAAQRAS